MIFRTLLLFGFAWFCSSLSTCLAAEAPSNAVDQPGPDDVEVHFVNLSNSAIDLLVDGAEDVPSFHRQSFYWNKERDLKFSMVATGRQSYMVREAEQGLINRSDVVAVSSGDSANERDYYARRYLLTGATIGAGAACVALNSSYIDKKINRKKDRINEAAAYEEAPAAFAEGAEKVIKAGAEVLRQELKEASNEDLVAMAGDWKVGARKVATRAAINHLRGAPPTVVNDNFNNQVSILLSAREDELYDLASASLSEKEELKRYKGAIATLKRDMPYRYYSEEDYIKISNTMSAAHKANIDYDTDLTKKEILLLKSTLNEGMTIYQHNSQKAQLLKANEASQREPLLKGAGSVKQQGPVQVTPSLKDKCASAGKCAVKRGACIIGAALVGVAAAAVADHCERFGYQRRPVEHTISADKLRSVRPGYKLVIVAKERSGIKTYLPFTCPFEIQRPRIEAVGPRRIFHR